MIPTPFSVVTGVAIKATNTEQESRDLQLMRDAEERRHMIQVYYREGFRRGCIWGLGISSAILIALMLLGYMITRS